MRRIASKRYGHQGESSLNAYTAEQAQEMKACECGARGARA